MAQIYAVIRTRGPAWDPAAPMESQPQWREHAAFMDRLVDDGLVLFGGPLEGTHDVLLVVRADDEAGARSRLDADCWSQSGRLRIKQVNPWTLRLGALD